MKRYLAFLVLVLCLVVPYSHSISLDHATVQGLMRAEMWDIHEFTKAEELIVCLKDAKASGVLSKEDCAALANLIDKYRACLDRSNKVYIRATSQHHL